MTTRHQAREIAFQILFQIDTHKQADAEQMALNTADLTRYFDHFRVPEAHQEFIQSLVMGTLRHLSEIDRKIETSSSNWKVARMPLVDRNILRLACFEMLHAKTHASICINEAVEIGKNYGTEKTPSFVNGILDAIKLTNPEA